MPSLNKVTLIGHVGKDPEVRHTQSGDAIASFSLATSEHWKTKSGEKQERTEWHRVDVFGKTAEIVQKYVSKGAPIYVEGSLHHEEWTDASGNKRNTTKVRVSGPNSRVLLLGGKRNAEPERTAGDASFGEDEPF